MVRKLRPLLFAIAVPLGIALLGYVVMLGVTTHVFVEGLWGQAETGQQYMNRLTSVEALAPWFERTERLLEQHEGVGVLSYLTFEDEEEFPVPEELQALGIIRF